MRRLSTTTVAATATKLQQPLSSSAYLIKLENLNKRFGFEGYRLYLINIKALNLWIYMDLDNHPFKVRMCVCLRERTRRELHK